METENLYEDSLEKEFCENDSSVFLFTNVQLTQQVRSNSVFLGLTICVDLHIVCCFLPFCFFLQEKAKQRLRLMSRRRRRRHRSFEIEMNYEELTLQTLQFCVMGYDVYSRQKVIGDVLLPLAELANQGMDITKELVMWRDIQTSQPVNNDRF